MIDLSLEEYMTVNRFAYPFFACLFPALVLLRSFFHQIRDIFMEIRNDMYLIGKRLHNLNDTARQEQMGRRRMWQQERVGERTVPEDL